MTRAEPDRRRRDEHQPRLPRRPDVRGHVSVARARAAGAGARPAAEGARSTTSSSSGRPSSRRSRRSPSWSSTEEGGAPTFHVGVEWLAVLLCLGLVAWRRNLLLGLVASSCWSSWPAQPGLLRSPDGPLMHISRGRAGRRSLDARLLHNLAPGGFSSRARRPLMQRTGDQRRGVVLDAVKWASRPPLGPAASRPGRRRQRGGRRRAGSAAPGGAAGRRGAAEGLSRERRRPRSRRAGSVMSADTATSVAAGRIVAEDLAVDRDDRRRPGDVGDVHPGPDDVRQGETALRQRRPMIASVARAWPAMSPGWRDAPSGPDPSSRRPSTRPRRTTARL